MVASTTCAVTVAHDAVVDDDHLDAQVPGHAAGSGRDGQLRSGCPGVSAQLLAMDGVAATALQVAAVRRRGEPSVGDSHDPRQAHMSFLT
jgi:hypothetical protein